MIFERIFFFSFLIVTLCSSLSKRIAYSTAEEESSREMKKLRLFDPEFIKCLEEIVAQDRTDKLIEYAQEYGSFLMDPSKTNILKICIETGKELMLKRFFNSVEEDVSYILVEALKLASLSKPSIFKALSSRIYLKTREQKERILEHVIKQNDVESLSLLFRRGFKFKEWRGKRGQSLVHILVQKNWIKFIKYVQDYDVTISDKSGSSAIFYVSTVEMVKCFRGYFPGARDQKNKHGKTIWQIFMESKNYEIVNSLISSGKRLKRFKEKQVDIYEFPWSSNGSILRINRQYLLRDSWIEIMKINRKWFQPKQIFFIQFLNETGIDAGGLKIEWISELLQQFFKSSSTEQNSTSFTAPLFLKADDESDVYAPNKSYNCQVFRFAGSIVALAMAMNVGLKVKFIPSIYRAILQEELDLETDLREQSPSIYRNFQFLKLSTTKLSDLELTLLSNPQSFVTRRNLSKYIREYSLQILIERYKDEISEFVKGFHSVLPVKVSNYFTFEELRNVLTGKPADFTAEEFLENCDCKCLGTKEALGQFITEVSVEQRGLLLKFITGLNSLPIQGIAGLNDSINVEIDDSLIGKLPTSATCSFLLKVPPFVDYSHFKETLMMSIELSNTTDNEPGVIEGDGIVLGFDPVQPSEELSSENHHTDTESEVSSISDDSSEEEEAAFID